MYGLSAADLDAPGARPRVRRRAHPVRGRGRAGRRRAAAGRRRRRTRRARSSSGCYATNMPVEVGGQGCTMLQQVLVQEQAGRVTNALGWVMAHAAGLVGRGRDADQLER